MNSSIIALSPESHAMITEINRAYREGWVNFMVRDNLIAHFLANAGKWPQVPTFQVLLEDFTSIRNVSE